MRKSFSIAAIGLSVFAMVATTAGAVIASPASTGTCTAVDAPKAMNELPASDDCGDTASSGLHANALTANWTGVAPTTVINTGTPLSFDATNGDVLAITRVNGAATAELAIGGNFTSIRLAGGTVVAATNFAVVNEATGAVIFAGSPANSVTPADNYVRSLTSFNGVIYIGGDFDSFDGVARSHAAALDASFAVTAWNPTTATNPIRALAADGTNVYMGGDTGFVTATNPTTGAKVWAKAVTGGGVHALLATNGTLYAGGLFETYNGVTQHGLVEINTADGSLNTAFNANLRADTNDGSQYGAYNGEDPLALALGPNSAYILAGIGGHAPAGLSSNEAILLNATTGVPVWKYSTIGDGQAVGSVGDTTVVGYHNSGNNTTSGPYYSAQLENSTHGLTTYDPQITMSTGANADGGNGGVQAMYVDQNTDTIYLGGAFIWYAGSFQGGAYASLIAFSFTTPTATAPNAPKIGTATAGDTTASVNWTPPVNDGGSTITGYTVTSSPGGLTATTTGATSAIVTGLTNGTAYTFTVTATNGIGTGAASAASAPVTPVGAVAPGTPTGVGAIAGDGQASVTWTAPASTGGAAITGYTVTSSPGGLTATTTGATSAIVTGLTDGTAYTFTVTATNLVGTGSASSPSSPVTPVAETPPGAPTAVTATAGDGQATVSWTAPTSNGGAPILDYTVTPTPSTAGSPVDVGTTATQTTITGLTDGTTYTFTVAALNGVGPSVQSAPSNAVTPIAQSSGGGGGPVPSGTGPVRISGADRFGTADAALAAEYPTARSAGAVVLATANNYPDALIGTALAEAKNAPLLFVSGSLSADTQTDIVRVLPPGGTVYLLGGTEAIPASVGTALTALGFVVTRYSGADRYATALAVANGLGNPSTVFLATGENFPDALAAGPAAAKMHGVVLLTAGSAMPASVQAYLTAHAGTVYAVGAPAAAADPGATALRGADRCATAVAVATSVFGASPTTIAIASGVTFPDALSGGVYVAHFGGPMLLSDPHVLPASTSSYLTSVKATVTSTAVFGGTAALSAAVDAAIATALGTT
jgi:hypothetical protein